MVYPMRRWWDVVGDLWMHGVGCVVCATWWGVMRSEGEPHDVCDGVQVGAARGAWGCRKVPCVEHNGEKVLGDAVTFLWMDQSFAFFLKVG
jgi:hypothetical protein